MTDHIQIGRRSVRLTHPERILFPGDGVTKRDLAEYYVDIGDVDRPAPARPAVHAQALSLRDSRPGVLSQAGA